MGRVLTVTYVFFVAGDSAVCGYSGRGEVQSVSADVEQTEEIGPKHRTDF